jgi:hypothetical protein
MMDNFIYFLEKLYLLSPLFVGGLMLIIWFYRGRNPEGTDNIIPFYDIPEQISPVEAGVLVDNKVDDRDISAQLIYCANKGYIEFDFVETKGGYVLKKTDKQKNLANENINSKLIDAIFEDNSVVNLSDLNEHKYSHHLKYLEFEKKAQKLLTEKGYYNKSPWRVHLKYRIIGILSIIFSVAIFYAAKLWFGFGDDKSVKYMFPLGLSGFIVLFVGFKMPTRTRKGELLREKLLGFKDYLDTTEEKRVKFRNDPRNKPENFGRWLPYAMVFGLEDLWSSIINRKGKETNLSLYNGIDWLYSSNN